MIELCNCVHSHYLDCLMERYKASKSFAECMGGCQCPCHFLRNGAFVPAGEWLEHRYAVARALQQAMQERHTDPRIEALIVKAEVEQ